MKLGAAAIICVMDLHMLMIFLVLLVIVMKANAGHSPILVFVHLVHYSFLYSTK